MDGNPPLRQVRAVFDDQTVTVYQAYSAEIAEAAVGAGTFVPPFKLTRMTWIKPSFFWMMYRSGWATKPGRERVLSIRVTREGLEDALQSACLSHFDPDVYPSHEEWTRRRDTSPVRIQWDPERGPDLEPLLWRSIQVGLGDIAARKYVAEWITDITDVTDRVRETHRDVEQGRDVAAAERPYPLSDTLAAHIEASLT